MNSADGLGGSDGAIFGLDNVRLELPLAGLGSRLLAAVLDYLLLFVLQMVWILGGGVLSGMLSLGGTWAFVLIAVGMFLLQWGYFAALEIATGGRTPGKAALGLRVVSQIGGRPSVMALLLRNLLRAIDFLTGLPMVAFDPQRRRLGDLVAGTLVLHQRPVEPEAEIAVERHPEGWSAREVAVVESFLRRAERLDPNRAQPMAQQLLEWIARREPEFWARVSPTLYPTGDAVVRLRQLLRHPETPTAVSSEPLTGTSPDPSPGNPTAGPHAGWA